MLTLTAGGRSAARAAGETARLRDRHLAYFLKFAEETEPKLLSHDQSSCLDRMEWVHDNMRGSLAWGLEKDPEATLWLAGAMWNFWNRRSLVNEGRGWLTKALRQVEAFPQLEGQAAQNRMAARAKALLGLGFLMMGQGDNAEAWGAFQESATLARQAAVVLDSTVKSLEAFQFAMSGVPLVSAFVQQPTQAYNPEKPLAESLGEVAAELESLPAMFVEMSAEIDKADDNLVTIQTSLTTMSTSVKLIS